MRRHSLDFGLLAAAALPAFAQEPINTTAATQPGVGRLAIREQFRYLAIGDLAGGETREYQLWSSAFLGLRHDFAIGAQLPLRLLDLSGADDELDLGDVQLLGKWRFHRADTASLDTERASAIVGLQLDTGDGSSLTPGFANDSLDPILGAVYTRVAGRHGFNADLMATIATDGDADEFRYDGSWLYRISPAAFAAGTKAAWYAVVELNGRYQTNGDHELLLAPGIMYEARRWTVELSVPMPLAAELDHRPEVDFTIVVGLRLLF